MVSPCHTTESVHLCVTTQKYILKCKTLSQYLTQKYEMLCSVKLYEF